MGYRYNVRDSEGADAGVVELLYEPWPGDEIILACNRRATVTGVLLHSRLAEFVSRPGDGALVVEPLGSEPPRPLVAREGEPRHEPGRSSDGCDDQQRPPIPGQRPISILSQRTWFAGPREREQSR